MRFFARLAEIGTSCRFSSLNYLLMATRCKDGRWKATWVDPSGKRRPYYAGSAEAAEFLKSQDIERTLGTCSTGETVHDAAISLWWPKVEAKRPNTQRRYADAYEIHIKPYFGHRTPSEVKHAEVQSWINGMTCAAASVGLYTSILSAIFKQCVKEGMCATNPVTDTDKPVIKRRKRVMSVGELKKLLKDVDGTVLAAPVFLAAVLGLRRGEACGLKWRQISGSRVSITEQRLIRQGPKGKKVGESDPKNEPSIRSFTLPPALSKELYRLGDKSSDYVCTNGRGKPWNPEHLTGAWAAERDALGFPGWTFHDLRHGAGGILAALGVDLLTIAAILGHSQIDTTLLYAAAQEATATKGLQKVGKALFRLDRRTRLVPS